MNTSEIVALLEANGLFERSITVERGAFLKKGGSIDTNIYFVEDGSLYIFIIDGEEEHIIRFGYKGSIIVSLDSFLTGKPSGFYIQAIKKTKLRIATKKSFLQFIRQSPAHQELWVSMLEGLVLQQIEREKDLLIQSPVERYKRVLKRSPQLFQQIPNKYIASYLRMSAETLSRLKKR